MGESTLPAEAPVDSQGGSTRLLETSAGTREAKRVRFSPDLNLDRKRQSETTGDSEAATKYQRQLLHIELGDVEWLSVVENQARNKAFLQGVPSENPEKAHIEDDAELGCIPFDRERTLEGMRKELESLQKFEVFTEISVDDPRAKEGRVIPSRWVFTEKGDRIKCRLVAQELALGALDGVFSPTPSSSAVRVALLHAALKGHTVTIADVETAFLHAPVKGAGSEDEVLLVRPPKPLASPGRLWVLNKALYGLRRAPSLWQAHLSDTLAKLNLTPCVAEPCLYRGGNLLVVCHVDDLMAVGPEAEVQSFFNELQKHLAIKIVGQFGDRWIKYLGKEWRTTTGGFLVRTPRSYLDSLLEVTGLSNAKGVNTPGSSQRAPKDSDEEPLEEGLYQQFRTALGKLLWISHERCDVSFAVKELSREATKPTHRTWEQLKRVCRYLKYSWDTVQRLTVTNHSKVAYLDLYCDANWNRGGKSTSCGHVQCSGFPLLFFSRTQTVVTLSSCEAELLALSSGLQEAKGLQNLLLETGLSLHIRAYSDSSSAISIASRKGPGKLRHISLRELWVQGEVRSKKVSLVKIPGTANPADLGTKHLGREAFEKCRELVGLLGTEDMSSSSAQQWRA
jgi:hypothetical protein